MELRKGPVRISVALAGTTGLMGRLILNQLLTNTTVGAIHVLARRELDVANARVTCHKVNFAALPFLPPVDEVYLALGTTIKAAGSQTAFRAVDFDANLAVARAALAAGARRCGLVSAMAANPASNVFYNRVKGGLEEALAQLPFAGLVIVRPSLLVGDRQTLGQPIRPFEVGSMLVTRLLGPLVPANCRPIAAARVARVLLARTPSANGQVMLLSGAMQQN